MASLLCNGTNGQMWRVANYLQHVIKLAPQLFFSRVVPVQSKTITSGACAGLLQASRPKPSTLPQADSEMFRPGYANLPALDSVSQSVKDIFKLEFASKQEWNKERIAQMKKQLQRHPGDTGSTPVQIGVMSVRIEYLKDHMRKNKKDKHTLRDLMMLIHKRRKLLVYLRRTDFARYHELLTELQIKPVPEHRFIKK